jgi:hypothetical protein
MRRTSWNRRFKTRSSAPLLAKLQRARIRCTRQADKHNKFAHDLEDVDSWAYRRVSAGQRNPTQ